MEQRREPRLETDQPVYVTILGAQEIRQEARVKNLAQGGFGLETAGPIPAGTLLKIELRDSILLGEVKHCRMSGNLCLVGVELEMLCPVEEFAWLVQRFADQGNSWLPEAPATPHSPVLG